MKVTIPELSPIENTKKEDRLDEGGSLKENAKSLAATAAAGDASKRKRSHEDEGDEESKRSTKKVDQKEIASSPSSS